MSNEDEKSSWLEPLPEEYAAEGDMTGRRMVIAALTVVILAIFGGVIWYSYLKGSDNGPVPVVRANKAVVKEKPDTPGGLLVPDQDKRVFNKVVSAEKDSLEQLAPSAELPVDRPLADEPTAAVKEELAAAEEPPTLLPPTAGDVKDGGFLVQLGAFGKETTAEQLWEKIHRANAVLLAGLRADIMMVDLGKKGVLYRLRGGMIADRPAAEKICDGLKAKKQACIVVAK